MTGRRALVVSLFVHGGALLVPMAWLQAVGGSGAEVAVSDPWRDGAPVFLASLESGPPAGGGGASSPPSAARSDAPAVEPEPAPRDPVHPDPVRPTDLPEPEPNPEPVPEAAPESAADSPAPGPESAVPSTDPVVLPEPGSRGAAANPETGGSPGGAGRPDPVFYPPRILETAFPATPEGRSVSARLLVGVEGRVLRVEPVEEDLEPEVLAAVRKAAEAMRFVPARRGNTAVEAWFAMTFVSRP